MNEQPLRAIGERQAVFHAAEIPARWFGRSQLTKRVMTGVIPVTITEDVEHAFILPPCQCTVTQLDQVGGVCVGCFATLDAQRQKGSVPPTVSLEQQEWMARPCKDHYTICAYPMCGNGLCPQHAAAAPDERLYCPLHLETATYEAKLVNLERNRGIIYAKGYDFFHSLFFDRYFPR